MNRDSRCFSFAMLVLVAIFLAACSHVKSVPIPAAANIPGSNPFLSPELENGRFSVGELGQWPLGWHRWTTIKMPICDAETVSARDHGPYYANCKSGAQCVKLQAAGRPFPEPCFFAQGIDASAYRGKGFTFHANLRAEVEAPSIVYLLVRVHTDASRAPSRDPITTTFFQHVPITSEKWANYQIKGVVDADARDIELGVQIRGQGKAWIDNASLQFSKNPKYPPVRDTGRLKAMRLDPVQALRSE
jgi:hypothetical protein